MSIAASRLWSWHFAVGRSFSAHVDVLHVSADPRQVIPYVGEGLSGALIDEVVAAAAD